MKQLSEVMMLSGVVWWAFGCARSWINCAQEEKDKTVSLETTVIGLLGLILINLGALLYVQVMKQ